MGYIFTEPELAVQLNDGDVLNGAVDDPAVIDAAIALIAAATEEETAGSRSAVAGRLYERKDYPCLNPFDRPHTSPYDTDPSNPVVVQVTVVIPSGYHLDQSPKTLAAIERLKTTGTNKMLEEKRAEAARLTAEREKLDAQIAALDTRIDSLTR